MNQSIISCVFLLFCVYFNQYIAAQDFGFGFPAHIDGEIKQSSSDRQPVYIPGRCPANQLLYPGDQEDDVVCDCAPGYLYHPETDKCYEVYKQGPCEAGEFLILPKNQFIPKCERNPCSKDGDVRYRGKCYTLGTRGPCVLPELSYVVAVDVKTLQIGCRKVSLISVTSRFNDDEFSYQLPDERPVCLIGSRRAIEKKCP